MACSYAGGCGVVAWFVGACRRAPCARYQFNRAWAGCCSQAWPAPTRVAVAWSRGLLVPVGERHALDTSLAAHGLDAVRRHGLLLRGWLWRGRVVCWCL